MLIALEGEELEQAGHMAEDIFVRMMKRRRAELGLSQADLAERVVRLGGSMYQQTIAKIESGQRAVRLAEADVIAQALETTVTKMLSAAIDEAASGTSRISIFDLLTQRKKLEHRIIGAEAMLADANEAAEAAQTRVAEAEYSLMLARTEVQRQTARRDELVREFQHLSRLSTEKQNEFNRRLGPRWRETLEKNPELEWETSSSEGDSVGSAEESREDG